MKKKAWIIALLVIACYLQQAAGPRGPGDIFERKDKLSEYQFFRGRLADLFPAEGVVPYDLNMALFSNYAEKLRFVRIPAGTTAEYAADGSIRFPVGTVLIKNFYYENDFRKPGKGRRILETRLLVHEEKGWTAYPYVWNEGQTEAFYDVAGDVKKVEYINYSGKRIHIDYIIPNKNQCKGCHIRGERMVPVGPAIAQLDRDFAYASGTKNQLAFWKDRGLIGRLPSPGERKPYPRIDDHSASLDERARAYLDVNCGTCHHPAGPANLSGLFLHYEQDASVKLGIMKSPVAAGRGAGNKAFDIVPGKPHKSILSFRMQTNDPGIAMPELGREQVHREGVKLIRDWIRKMEG